MEKPNEWESGLPAALHQAWTISRIQSNVNERTILYLTADTLAWSRLLNFCFMLSGKTMPFQEVLMSLHGFFRSTGPSYPFPSLNIQVVGLHQSRRNVCVQYFFRTFQRVIFPPFFWGEKTWGDYSMVKNILKIVLPYSVSSNFMNI